MQQQNANKGKKKCSIVRNFESGNYKYKRKTNEYMLIKRDEKKNTL